MVSPVGVDVRCKGVAVPGRAAVVDHEHGITGTRECEYVKEKGISVRCMRSTVDVEEGGVRCGAPGRRKHPAFHFRLVVADKGEVVHAWPVDLGANEVIDVGHRCFDGIDERQQAELTRVGGGCHAKQHFSGHITERIAEAWSVCNDAAVFGSVEGNAYELYFAANLVAHDRRLAIAMNEELERAGGPRYQ